MLRQPFSITALLLTVCVIADASPHPSKTHTERLGMIRGQPYDHFNTTDIHGRSISFYLSESARDDAVDSLVVYIQGSGATSHFADRGGRSTPRNGHITILEALGTRGRLMIVEKPGVQLGDDPKTVTERLGSDVFHAEHTLHRWADAVGAAIEAACHLPDIRPDGVLLIGHSEGGIVAARVARLNQERVSHLAILAGGGPTQLYSLVSLARQGVFFSHISDDAEERARHVQNRWAKIMAMPDSTEHVFFGHVFRRWSSFMRSSTIDESAGVKARIYIGQGTADQAVDPITADMLHATLLSRGQDVRYDRIENAGHSFEDTVGKTGADGWRLQMDRVLRWWLG